MRAQDAWERVKDFISRRRNAYCKTLLDAAKAANLETQAALTLAETAWASAEAAKMVLDTAKKEYRDVFKGPYGEEVLMDLAKFCRAHESTFHADARAHAVAEGRREVWLRIQKNLQLTDEQLWALHPAAPVSRRSSDA